MTEQQARTKGKLAAEQKSGERRTVEIHPARSGLNWLWLLREQCVMEHTELITAKACGKRKWWKETEKREALRKKDSTAIGFDLFTFSWARSPASLLSMTHSCLPPSSCSSLFVTAKFDFTEIVHSFHTWYPRESSHNHTFFCVYYCKIYAVELPRFERFKCRYICCCVFLMLGGKLVFLPSSWTQRRAVCSE